MRHLAALALFAGAFVGVALGQPPGPQDHVYYVPKKGAAVKNEDAEVKVDASGVKITNTLKMTTTVTAADVVRTYPVDLKEAPRAELNAVVNLEVAKDWDKARAGYEGLKEKYKTGASDRLRKWLAFRTAYTTARAASGNRPARNRASAGSPRPRARRARPSRRPPRAPRRSG